MTATLLAQTLVGALVGRCHHVVLCPGSRSAPIALALEEAAREGRLDLHVRVDERAAGFLALGLARSRPGEADRTPPVAIVTTSGTAVGNLLPAVMEAAHSGAPLLVISADRPSAMVHTGANQTTDQVRIFGQYARADARISSAEGDPDAWAFQVARAVELARGTLTRDPGPVHLNVALAEPLVSTEPRPDHLPRGFEVHPPECEGAREVRGHQVLDEYPLTSSAPTVVLVGDATPDEGQRARAFAESAGLPLLAEPTSNARSGPNAIRSYRLLLDSPLGQQIRRVVVFGHPTLSRPVTRLLKRRDVETLVVATAPHVQVSAPGMRVVPGVVWRAPSPGWVERWQAADRAASARLDTLLADPLTGQAVAAAVVASIGAGGTLVAGSSNPIRDLDLAPIPADGFPAHANRGLAGIDGTIATAQGIALGSDRPTTALMGDLTFLHDVGSLLIGPLERRPRLRIVVANDDGGSIFHTLEQGAEDYATGFERVFATPTGVALEPLAQAYGWAYARASDLDELELLLGKEIEGPEIIEVPLARAARRSLDAQLRGLAGQPE